MVGEINLAVAIINQWVKDSNSECKSLNEAREYPEDYWVIEAISHSTGLAPLQVVDSLIARVKAEHARAGKVKSGPEKVWRTEEESLEIRRSAMLNRYIEKQEQQKAS